MRRPTVFVAIFLAANIIFAQNFDNHWIIKPVLDSIDDFEYTPKGHESLFVATKSNKRGVLDSAGKLVVSAEYSQIDIRPSGWIEAWKDGKRLWFNHRGVDQSSAYDRFIALGSGRAIVFKGDKCGVIDNDGTVLIPVGQERYVNFDSRYVFFKENEEVEYVDPPAKVFKSVQADADAKARSVLKGYYMVAQGKKCGFLNAEGDTVIPVLYELGAIHPKGYILASLEPNIWGVIDRTHKVLRHFTLERAGRWTDSGLLPVRENKTWGLLRFPGGEVVIPFGEYDHIEVCDPKKDWFVVKKGKKSGIVDAKNQILLPLRYEYVSPNDRQAIWLIDGNRYGYWHIASNTLQEPMLRAVRNMHDSLFILTNDSLSAVMNVNTGRFVIPFSKAHFEKSGPFFTLSRDEAHYSQSRYRGLYNRKGELIYEADSVWIRILANHTFFVEPYQRHLKASEHRDSDGKILRVFEPSTGYNSGNCWIRLNKNYEVQDKYFSCADTPGKENIYDSVSKIAENLYLVQRDNFYGYADNIGRIVFPTVFEKAYPSKDGYLKVKYQGKWGVLKNPAF
jgi:WG containing repeat